MRGNLIVGQSGGPTPVINASLVAVVEEAVRHDAIGEIYGMRFGVRGLLGEDLVDLRRVPAATLEGLRRTPSAALGTSRMALGDAEIEQILRNLQARQIRFFLYIGGNGSTQTALRVDRLAAERRYELRVIAIPKTIDNDLPETDHCPGHPSVARWLAVSVREAGLDTEAIGTADPIKVVETMGRNTGWLAASTALARQHDGDAPHLIYLPERPFVREQFLADVGRVYRERGHAVIATAEGLVDKQGQFVAASTRPVEADPLGRPQFGGSAAALCELVMTHLKLKARFDKPGTIQRVSGLLTSDVDAQEASQVGQAAVREALAGRSGVMITLIRHPGATYRSTTGTVSLDRIAGHVRPMPDEFIAASGHDVTPAYVNYVRPLVGALPQYTRLPAEARTPI